MVYNVFFIEQTIKTTFQCVNRDQGVIIGAIVGELLDDLNVVCLLILVIWRSVRFTLKTTTLLLDIELTPLQIYALIVEKFVRISQPRRHFQS